MSKFSFDAHFNLPDGQCIIKKSICEFNSTENDKERTLEFVFSDHRNDRLEVVLTQVVLLNEFYSTRLNSNKSGSKDGRKQPMDVVAMAHHIIAWSDFSEYCMSEDSNKRFKAVEYIRKTSKEYQDAYSFATKYCSWHNPNHYPICDSYSKGMLYYLGREGILPCERFTQDALKEYGYFCQIYDMLINYLENNCNKKIGCRELDKFLWYYGKHNNIKIEN